MHFVASWNSRWHFNLFYGKVFLVFFHCGDIVLLFCYSWWDCVELDIDTFLHLAFYGKLVFLKSTWGDIQPNFFNFSEHSLLLFSRMCSRFPGPPLVLAEILVFLCFERPVLLAFISTLSASSSLVGPWNTVLAGQWPEIPEIRRAWALQPFLPWTHCAKNFKTEPKSSQGQLFCLPVPLWFHYLWAVLFSGLSSASCIRFGSFCTDTDGTRVLRLLVDSLHPLVLRGWWGHFVI